MIDMHPLQSMFIFNASRGISASQQNSERLSRLDKEASPALKYELK